MKLYIFVILLFFQFFSATAQTSFEFTLDDPLDQCGGSMIEDSNNNIILSVWNNQFAKLIKLNNEGILIDSVDIRNPNNGNCVLFHLLKIDSSKFMAFGKYNTDTIFNLWVVTFDYNFNIIWDTKIPVNGDIITTFQYSILNYTGDIVVFSTYVDSLLPTIHKLVLHELNNSGVVVKEKYLAGIGISSDIIILLSPTKYRLIVYGNIQKDFLNIYDLDTNFAIINYYPLQWDLHYQNTIKFINDTNFLISGKKIFPNNERDLGLIKTDINNNLIDYKHYGRTDTIDYPGVHNNLDFVSENNIYYGGISNLNISNPYYSQMPSWFILNKIDSNLNLKWQKFYGGDACYVPLTILATQDGGCVMAGTRYDYRTQPIEERDVYVLKVDEDGIITWTQEIPINEKQTSVYPNPGTNQLNIKPKLKNSTFELIDFTGKIIIRKLLNLEIEKINTSNIPSGMYFYRIHDNEKIIESGKWVKI